MTISRRRSPILVDYEFNGKSIERVSSMKDLCVVYDNKLSFVSHVELASKKGNSMLSFVKRQCHGTFNADTVKLL